MEVYGVRDVRIELRAVNSRRARHCLRLCLSPPHRRGHAPRWRWLPSAALPRRHNPSPGCPRCAGLPGETGREGWVVWVTIAHSSVQILKSFFKYPNQYFLKEKWCFDNLCKQTLLLTAVYQFLTWTMVSRFCRDVDTVLITDVWPMVTTVTWWGCGGWTGAGTMTVAWCVGAGGVAGANTW